MLGIIVAQPPLSESAIGMQMPGIHSEIIAGCLRRLREKQHIERNEAGLWSVGKQQEIAVSDAKEELKTCPRCKKTKPAADFHANGYCAPCGRAKSAEYAAKRKGNAAAPAKAGRKKKAKGMNGVPLQMGADRMVIMQFAIRIEDSAGVTHDLFLTGDVVKRLAIELQEYA